MLSIHQVNNSQFSDLQICKFICQINLNEFIADTFNSHHIVAIVSEMDSSAITLQCIKSQSDSISGMKTAFRNVTKQF